MIQSNTIVDERYKIISVLGTGGMGTVYLAQELALDRIIALKVLHPTLVKQSDSKSRFLREAAICASLKHEHINEVYRFGVWRTQFHYMALEFLDGQTLRSILQKEEKLSWQRTIYIAVQIAEAMSYAHKQGIVHRDLKPENIMVMDKQSVDCLKILDFGLAKVLTPNLEQQKLTETGSLIGSINYMSPEQCKGQATDQTYFTNKHKKPSN